MDFIREWKSKRLDPEQVFGGVLDASQRRFHSHVFFRPTELSEAKSVLCPFLDFIDRKLSKNIQLEIVVLHRRSERFISPGSWLNTELNYVHLIKVF